MSEETSDHAIKAVATSLENRRVVAVARRSRFLSVGTVIGFVLAAVTLLFAEASLFGKLISLAFGGAAGALVGYGLGSSQVSAIERDARTQLIGAVAARHGLQFTVSGFSPSHLEALREMELLPQTWDSATFCDQLTGLHDGRAFATWGLHAKEKHTTTTTDKDGNTKTETRWETLFCGRVYVIDWKQKFLGRTYIARRGWFNFAPAGSYEITPSDPRFISDFAIFTNDGTEGHYLIDPLMIERLIAIEAANEGKALRGAFFQQRLLLVLSGQDALIDLDMSQSIASDEALDLIDQKVSRAFSLVDQVS